MDSRVATFDIVWRNGDATIIWIAESMLHPMLLKSTWLGWSVSPVFGSTTTQLAQQGLGGMGGMRPPGKTGLLFDVILSHLQANCRRVNKQDMNWIS
jgi:hypothetical protein